MATARASHFKKLQNFKSDYAVAEFTQYESTRTGLRVVVVDRRSTKVQGEFCLATEIHDDSGAPHTLEHLVFMVYVASNTSLILEFFMKTNTVLL